MKDCSQSSTKYFNRALAATLLLLMLGTLLFSHAQAPSSLDRQRSRDMLSFIKDANAQQQPPPYKDKR